MSEHKLNLSAGVRAAVRSRFDAQKKLTLPPDGLYLAIGSSNIGRNKAKRERALKAA